MIGYISSNHGTCKTRAQVQVQVPTAIIIERLKCLVDLRNLRICNEAVAIRCENVLYLREKYFHASLKVWKKKRTGSVLIGLSKFSNGTSLRAGSPRDGLGVQPPGQVSLRAFLQARKVRAIVRLFWNYVNYALREPNLCDFASAHNPGSPYEYCPATYCVGMARTLWRLDMQFNPDLKDVSNHWRKVSLSISEWYNVSLKKRNTSISHAHFSVELSS